MAHKSSTITHSKLGIALAILLTACNAPPPAGRTATPTTHPPIAATPIPTQIPASTALPSATPDLLPAVAPSATPAPKLQATVRFTLDWIPEAPSSPFYVALEKGYFAAEGLQVSIEPGSGSAVSVAKVADGSFDLGYADINSMIEFNDKNPDKAMLAIGVVYNVAPFTIFTLKNNNIKEPKDLIGKKLGAPAGDAARRLWPLFARLTTIDPASVEWVTIEPAQREAALARGDVDAISGFYSTSWFGLVKNKVSRADIVTIKYSDYGLALYGNSIVASAAYLKDNPEVPRAFLRALARGWKDTLLDPKAAIETLKRANPKIDAALELRRLEQVIFLNYLTAEVKQVGFGQVVPDRLTRNIELITEGFGLQTKPAPDAVFTDIYLPPLADRLPPSK